MPKLQVAAHKADSIQIGSNTGNFLGGEGELDDIIRGGKWEDEEERRFFEDIIDLKDYVPKGVLGIDDDDKDGSQGESSEEKAQKEKERVEEEVRKLEEELAELEVSDQPNGAATQNGGVEDADEGPGDDDGYDMVARTLGLLGMLTSNSEWRRLPLGRQRPHLPELRSWHPRAPHSFLRRSSFAFPMRRIAR